MWEKTPTHREWVIIQGTDTQGEMVVEDTYTLVGVIVEDTKT